VCTKFDIYVCITDFWFTLNEQLLTYIIEEHIAV
jgi:hypothetical protein